ncbi:hypothetical protein ACWOEH_02265 [Enterococcus nangangensis]
MELRLIDNKGDNTLGKLLTEKITKDSKLSIQTAAFSIFAFHSLQDEIKKIKGTSCNINQIFFRKVANLFLKFPVEKNKR